MKTLKTLTILALAVSLILGPVGYAAAAPPNWQPQPTPNFPLPPIQPAPPSAPPSTPTPSPSGDTHHYYYDRGPSWGAILGGTMLGVVTSGMGNQSKQASQPTVVVIQQPVSDTTAQQQYLAQEIERERAKARDLEEEIKRLKANTETE